MKKSFVTFPSFVLAGISCRTQTSLEWDPQTARIAPTIQAYFQNEVAKKISDCQIPGVTYCAFTRYESDFKGEYDFFIGEKVLETSSQTEEIQTLFIPEQRYVKFTTDSGPMPNVCIDAWREIWGMSDEVLGGVRAYITDFEVYDERSLDPNHTVLDIYIGLQ